MFSAENHKNWAKWNENAIFFTGISFAFTNNIVIRKYLYSQNFLDAVIPRYKKSSC